MRQAKLEFTDLDLVPRAELRSPQTRQVGLPGEVLHRRETKDLLAPEHQHAVVPFNRRVPQNQVIVFAASNPNHRRLIFEMDGAEDGGIVDQLKHGALLANGPLPADL